MPRPPRTLALVLLAFALGCAGTPTPSARAPEIRAVPSVAMRDAGLRAAVVRTATSMIGVPYRYGGATPRGFDCSGLVVYSYARAGIAGLPHSVVALERRTRPIPFERLQPGDLIFFELEGRKAAHVAIYLGNGAFVHAPSAGKPVERVSLDHVYWGTRVRHAGRLAPSTAH